MVRLSNPLAFTRGPVTIITTIIYLAVIISLIVLHTTVPPAPKSATPIHGVNLTEAWLDLQHLTTSYHPFNSRANDYVHDWLLLRISSILNDNKANSTAARVFNDRTSNLTFSSANTLVPASGISVYFEGTNIIVYIRGSEDDPAEWWKDPTGKPSSRNGVLVNAHYDSVSTGFGATDDGVGVISILQLVRYYTTAGNKPKNGLVLLLNNGEEDFLNGAQVFSQHPMAKLPSTFLNLEGAGAGGRAALFRSTDAGITKAYGNSPYPFGTTISGDAFKRGLVRSQTDYVIFNGVLGLRGLDVAFVEPRARYHTNQDDSVHTGKNSLWHMLSAAVATTKQLTSHNLESNFDAKNNPGSPAVWFDILGQRFAVFQTHTLFALSVTLLVAGPIFLLLTLVILYRLDKFYLWSGSRKYHLPDGEEDSVPINGWRGFFRFPLILLLACAAPVALAYLLFKENEFIVHSSEWAVWGMMVSSFIFVAWFFCRAADFTRPSALTRAYGLSWLCLGWWALLVAATVFEEQIHVSGVYFVLFYTATVFVGTFLSYLELFSLPKKTKYCNGKFGDEHPGSRSRSASRSRNSVRAPQEEDDEGTANEDDEPTERSGLLRGRGRSAFKKYGQQQEGEPEEETGKDESHDPHEEQEWSKSMWSWLWLLQILVLAPINLIVVGQIGLYLVSALHQTGADGSSVFTVYLGIAIITILLFSPIVPLLHRFTWHVPMFLLLVLIGTLIYNLIAFPFSSQNRLKLFFQQEIDLDTGANNVSFVGVTPYVQNAISTLPSSAGQSLECSKYDSFSERRKCSWHGIPPNVADQYSPLLSKMKYKSLVNFNVSRTSNSSAENTATFNIQGKNTRACKITFDSPVHSFHVKGQGPPDRRFAPVPESGSREIRLWSRTWNRMWTVDVKWGSEDEEAREVNGKVVCIWSDVNQEGVIPAFDEATHFAPDWVAVTKAGDGLVEGFKRFSV